MTRRPPRRTLTDNASEFLHAVDDMLASGSARATPGTGAPGVVTPHPRPTADAARPPPPLAHRSLTLDSFGFDSPPMRRTRAPASGLAHTQDDLTSMASAVGWAPNEWSGAHGWPARPAPPGPSDPVMLDLLGGVLSSSPDETPVPIHADSYSAFAMGHGAEPTRGATMGARPRQSDYFAEQTSPVHDALLRRMKSMTLMPSDVPHDRTAAMAASELSQGTPSPTGSSNSGRTLTPRGSMSNVVLRNGEAAAYGAVPRADHAEMPGRAAAAADALSPSHERSTSPRGRRRDDGKWFGRPGTLRLGETVSLSAVPHHPHHSPLTPHGHAPRDDGDAVARSAAAPMGLARYDVPAMPRRGSGRCRGHHGASDHGRGTHHRRDDHGSAHGGQGAPGRGPWAHGDDAHRLDLAAVQGQLVEISMDQHGSRLIQEKLDHSTPEDRALVYQELYPEARRLMADVFGNYVVQKLLEYGTPEQVRSLAQQMQGHVLALSLGTYGCRVVQKAFERVQLDQKIALSRELHAYVLDCVRDQNANHVVQKILEQVPNSHLEFIAEAFQGQVPTLASHCYSCRVLQRIFAYCSDAQRRPLLDEMHSDILRLMQDQYGNYVVQWVLQHGAMDDRLAIVRKTKSHLLQLSRHKFASNVIEHVIEVAPPGDLADLLDELLSPLDGAEADCVPLPPDNGLPVSVATVMMQDQYANYVLQRFLQVLTGAARERLVYTIRPVLDALRQRHTLLAAQHHGGVALAGSIRTPGGGHIGSKPFQAIERLIEQPPSQSTSSHAPTGGLKHVS